MFLKYMDLLLVGWILCWWSTEIKTTIIGKTDTLQNIEYKDGGN